MKRVIITLWQSFITDRLTFLGLANSGTKYGELNRLAIKVIGRT